VVFKHGLVPVEVHSWLVANLAVTLAREKGLPAEDQADCFYFGLTHDAGVFSLKGGDRGDRFDHTTVGEGELSLLLQLIEGRYGVKVEASVGKEELIRFAHFHASSHFQNLRNSSLETLNKIASSGTVDCVVEADWIASGREKFGYQRRVLPLFKSYTTEYAFDTPYRRLNIASFLEHVARLNEFRRILSIKADSIAEELGIPQYQPIISESTWAIEYYLARVDQEGLTEGFDEWLRGRNPNGTITVNTRSGPKTIRTQQGVNSMEVRCLLCGKPGRFYSGVKDPPEVREQKKALKASGLEGPESRISMGRGDVSRVLGFEIDTWRGNFDGGRTNFQDHHLGLCDDCASCLRYLGDDLDGLLIFVPRTEDVYESYTDTLHLRRLREWSEWADEGLCSPEPQFLSLDYWKRTRDYSEVLMGLDDRRARYERAKEIYRQNVGLFKAEDRGVYASAELSPELAKVLLGERFMLAPSSIGCVKPSRSEEMVVKGFSFKRGEAARVLMLLSSGVRMDRSKGFAENMGRIVSSVPGLGREDLDLIVSDYDRILEAVGV